MTWLAARTHRSPTLRRLKRYFKVYWESPIGAGPIFHEFDGTTPTRQAEEYAGRWFSSRDEYHDELGPGLTDLPLSEDDFEPEQEISVEEFEAAWREAGLYGLDEMPH